MWLYPIFFIRKGAGRRTEHLKVFTGHSDSIKDAKQGIFGWMQEQGHDVCFNMLQAERHREIGFLLTRISPWTYKD